MAPEMIIYYLIVSLILIIPLIVYIVFCNKNSAFFTPMGLLAFFFYLPVIFTVELFIVSMLLPEKHGPDGFTVFGSKKLGHLDYGAGILSVLMLGPLAIISTPIGKWLVSKAK